MPTSRTLRTPNLTARKAFDAALTELEGVTDEVADVLKRTLQVETIQDLAESPYFGFADEVTKALTAPRHVYRRLARVRVGRCG